LLILGFFFIVLGVALVDLIAHVDPVAVHVDGLAEMRDVARVLLPAHGVAAQVDPF
jgi:hypothetical protein